MKKIVLAASAAVWLLGAGLEFDEGKFETKTLDVGGKAVKFRAYENIVYVANPVDTQYQRMNFYAPIEYFEGGKIGKFDAASAPIFFPNSVGGYMPGKAAAPGLKNGKPNAILEALARGYVVAAPGARGRTLTDAQGNFTGKAPAAIVDLKAAVRYLKFNDAKMPGDANKIVSNGTSAGGALSALLGVSADAPEFEPYLKALGAAPASDEIYAVSAYCPITNLDNADAAYEWMFNGVDEYEKMDFSGLDAGGFNERGGKRKTINGTLTQGQKSLSNERKTAFVSYVNSLNLKDAKGRALSLEANGEGSFKEYLKKALSASFAEAKRIKQISVAPKFIFLKEDGCELEYTLEFDDYLREIKRAKTPLAFDDLNLANPENDLFGDVKTASKHFTAFAKERGKGEMADAQIIKMMNAMNYLANKNAAKFYRIRHGSADRDTALAVPLILALGLQNAGKSVDFAVPWGQGHGGDYDLDELFTWIDGVVK